MEYSNLIRQLRHKMVLSQKELSKKIGVSITSVNRWENGKFEPTIKVKRRINKLCKKFNVGIED